MVEVPFCLAYFHTAFGKYNVGSSTRSTFKSVCAAGALRESKPISRPKLARPAPARQSRRCALGAAIQGWRSVAEKIGLSIATTY
jgi:hypothetical protein